MNWYKGVRVPSDDEIAFIDAIRDEPDNDATKLVFADWLEENGETNRGAFVRECVMNKWDGCRCYALTPFGGGPCSLCNHVNRFVRDHESAFWVFGFDSNREAFADHLMPYQVFGMSAFERLRRGFIWDVEMSLDVYDEWGPWLVRKQPIRSIKVVFSPFQVYHHRDLADRMYHYKVGNHIRWKIPEKEIYDQNYFPTNEEHAIRVNGCAARIAREVPL